MEKNITALMEGLAKIMARETDLNRCVERSDEGMAEDIRDLRHLAEEDAEVWGPLLGQYYDIRLKESQRRFDAGHEQTQKYLQQRSRAAGFILWAIGLTILGGGLTYIVEKSITIYAMIGK